jgi:acetyl/propionyl-CoA carboxylase alpha subunit
MGVSYGSETRDLCGGSREVASRMPGRRVAVRRKGAESRVRWKDIAELVAESGVRAIHPGDGLLSEARGT